MGPYRTPAEDTPRRDDRKVTLEDAGLPLLVAGLSAPMVVAALSAGVTWGVGESIAAAALSLALANLGARVHRGLRGGFRAVSLATASHDAPKRAAGVAAAETNDDDEAFEPSDRQLF